MDQLRIRAREPTSPEPFDWIVQHTEEYERAFFPLYRDYLEDQGLPPCEPTPVQMAMSHITKRWGTGYARRVYAEDMGINPYLITGRSFAELSRLRGSTPISYSLSIRGLVYENVEDAISDSARDRDDIPIRDHTVDAPSLLLRGQRGLFVPESPLVRTLRAPPEHPVIRFPHSAIHSSLLFYLFSSVFEEHELDSDGGLVKTATPTPFHLLLLQSGLDRASAHEYGRYVADVLRIQTLNVLTEKERRLFVAHLTDYEMPVPVVTILRCPQDFVPNPFVSTTTNIGIALLYASGYFVEHNDKFGVDWSKVASLCSGADSEERYLYVIASPRWTLPMTKLAGAETIGANEHEYGIPCGVEEDEIVEIVPLRRIVDRLGAEGLKRVVMKQPDVESDEGIRFLKAVTG